jgi:hypothetical protein
MGRGNRFKLTLFGLAMIGAKDCDPWAAWDGNSGTLPPPPRIASYCTTDPPIDCVAICFVVGTGDAVPPPPSTPTLMADCGSGGLVAQQFVDDVTTILTCNPNQYPDMSSYVVFPTFFQLTPMVTQTTGQCVQPPALPGTMPLSTFMGFDQ